MKQNKKTSAKLRILLFFSMYAVAFLLVIWVCNTLFLDDIYEAIRKSEIRSFASEIIRKIDSDGLKEIVEKKAKSSSTCVLVYKITGESSGTVVVSANGAPACIIHKLSDESVFRIYSETKDAGGKLTDIFDMDFPALPGENINDDKSERPLNKALIYSTVIQNRAGDEYFVLLNSSITPLISTVQTMNVVLLLAGSAMIVLAIILAVIISSSLIKPIEKINARSKELASGNYTPDFEGGSYREITELSETLNRTASELAKVEGLKRELISNTSHDLRTPLTMISGYAEIMRDLPGENTPENAQIIIDETKRLSSIVNDMLDISKLESGNQEINKEIFSLTEAIDETVDRYRHFTFNDGFIINFYGQYNVMVETDRSKYLQAFCNLMNNALTYTGEDKRVDVYQNAYFDDTGCPWVRITVCDTGEGIPADKLSLIWDRYYKLDSVHRRSVQGSGLGLSIVNKIMQLLGGRCDVISKEHNGSAFSLEIPFINQAPIDNS